MILLDFPSLCLSPRVITLDFREGGAKQRQQNGIGFLVHGTYEFATRDFKTHICVVF